MQKASEKWLVEMGNGTKSLEGEKMCVNEGGGKNAKDLMNVEVDRVGGEGCTFLALSREQL